VADENLLKYGILRARDIAALYYGARMVAFAKYSFFSVGKFDRVQILGPDPRRIKFELYLFNTGSAASDINIADDIETLNTAPLDVSAGPGLTVVIRRTFLSDLDAVCLPLWVVPIVNTWTVSVRETLLTPAPVDEVPLAEGANIEAQIEPVVSEEPSAIEQLHALREKLRRSQTPLG
jgi:hypothetical protein